MTGEVDEVVLDASDYKPNPTQARFHASRSKVKGLLAGYRGGKTRAGAEEAVVLATENEGLDGLIVAPTWGILNTVTLRAFHDWESHTGACPLDLIDFHNVGKRYFQLVNGSRVYYGSADRPGSLEGTTLSWWWLDEARLVRREAWRILIARLSDPRAKRIQGLVTSTPAAGWLEQEFGSPREEREVFHASTRENEAHLPAGYVAGLERTYSAREARVLVEGEFGLLVGAVLEEFERKTHLVDWKYDERLRTVAMWDPGYRRPFWGWAQFAPGGWQLGSGRKAPPWGAWIIFDEIIDENLTTEVLADRVAKRRYRFSEVYCDPAADSANPDTGVPALVSMKSALATRGFAAQFRYQRDPKWRHIPTGIAILRGMLKNARGESSLLVARSLADPKKSRGVVKDFEGYAYPEAKDGRPVGDMPVKDGLHDHGCDGVRYWAVGMHLSSGGPSAQTIASL